MAVMSSMRDTSPSPSCKVCGRASASASYLCKTCRHLLDRLEMRSYPDGRRWRMDKDARFRAMCRQWNSAKEAFLCHYTGLPLLTENKGSRRYATWEHVIPGDESSVVLAANIVNKMKSDMTEAEFKRLVRALADHFDMQALDESAWAPMFHTPDHELNERFP